MVHGLSSLAANSKPDLKANGTKYGFVEVTDHSLALAGTFVRIYVLFKHVLVLKTIGPLPRFS